MLNTKIKTIPHRQHRYSTVGDYYHEHQDENVITKILVSDMRNEKYEFLVSIHEQIEEFLTRSRGITETEITKFDINFEKNRKPDDFSEPGDSLQAPYNKEHRFATFVEKLLAIELGIDWNDYEKAIDALDEPSNTGP